MGWSKPVWSKRSGKHTLRVSPFTKTKVSGSTGFGPLRITATGRVYLFGARIR